ncbi:unnamed protein product, partial [Soboliphyme baturini]|uniref:Peptidase_M1_N domain-containing protein n=1 Tax=Soboliphyme baturini TaxID=241478 RepID=A0A183JB37_9BILA
LQYNLTLKPYLPPAVPETDPKVFTFDGSVSVLLRCEVPTDVVVMNMKAIKLQDHTLRLSDFNGRRLAFATQPYVYNSSLETVTFQLSTKLLRGFNYTLSVNYTARLGDNNAGFYKSKYVDGDVVR